MRYIRKGAIDLVVLDVSGSLCSAELFQSVRRLVDVPLIALFQQQDEANTVEATYYLKRPFTEQELIEVVERALTYPKEMWCGPIKLDLRRRTVSVPHQDDPEILRPKLFALLRLLMQNRGEVVTREQLMSEVWNTDFMEDTRTLDVHVRWLRQIIEPTPNKPVYLRTVRGVGYYIASNKETLNGHDPG